MAAKQSAKQHINALMLLHIGHLAAEGDFGSLLSMGLRPAQITKLQQVVLMDLMGMANRLNGTLINATLDPDALDTLLAINERASQEREIEMALVKAGASQKLMKRLFGLNVHQYVMLRDVAGVKGTATGRRPKPDEATERRVHEEWGLAARGTGCDDSDGLAEARRYLAAHAATQLDVRDIEAVLGADGSGPGSPA